MTKFKDGDIVERIKNPSEKYQIMRIYNGWYHLKSLQTGAVHLGAVGQIDSMLQAQQVRFKVGDKLRYKIALIDLTFEVIAIKDGEYFLKSSKGEEVSADYFHVQEVLEVFK